MRAKKRPPLGGLVSVTHHFSVDVTLGVGLVAGLVVTPPDLTTTRTLVGGLAPLETLGRGRHLEPVLNSVDAHLRSENRVAELDFPEIVDAVAGCRLGLGLVGDENRVLAVVRTVAVGRERVDVGVGGVDVHRSIMGSAPASKQVRKVKTFYPLST